MRSLRRELRSLTKKVTTFLMGLILLAYCISLVPSDFYVWLIIGASLVTLTWILLAFNSKPEKYINERGYVVLVRENELEHRHIAKQLLGRELASNEVVHHINGMRADNNIWNLCLMDGEEHEHFHAWLRWKKEKEKRYPPFTVQKRVLVEKYGGTLLEDLKPLPQISPLKSEEDVQLKIFNELKYAMKWLANKNKIPDYLLIDDEALKEMANILPMSKWEMLNIKGIGFKKFKIFGPYLIGVMKKYKKAG